MPIIGFDQYSGFNVLHDGKRLTKFVSISLDLSPPQVEVELFNSLVTENSAKHVYFTSLALWLG